MTNTTKLTIERLRELVSYDPETGLFTRIRKNTNSGCGWPDKAGYFYLMVDSRTYAVHRLAWFYMTGNWPIGEIDHINSIRNDNRFCNLRDVDRVTNMQNERKARKNNKSGFMGVHWRADRSRWVANIRVDGKSIRLGSFKTAEEAEKAYVEGKRFHHPGFTG